MKMRFVADAALPRRTLSLSAATGSLAAAQPAGAGDSVGCMHALCCLHAVSHVGFLEKELPCVLHFLRWSRTGLQVARTPCKALAPEREQASNQKEFLEDAWGRWLPGTPNPAFCKLLTPSLGFSHLEVSVRNPKDLSAPS